MQDEPKDKSQHEHSLIFENNNNKGRCYILNLAVVRDNYEQWASGKL